MRKSTGVVLSVLAAGVLLAGCGGAQPQGVGSGSAAAAPTTDKIISSIPGVAPEWITKEPAEKDGFLWFVGLSDKQATQQGARDSAEKNSRARVVAYLGSAFSEKLQKLTVSAGLSSDVVDPTVARRGFEETMTAGVASKVRVSEWYIERWARPSGEEYWMVYGLANVPSKAIEEAYAAMMTGEAAKAAGFGSSAPEGAAPAPAPATGGTTPVPAH
jgi:predicted small secreted protein